MDQERIDEIRDRCNRFLLPPPVYIVHQLLNALEASRFECAETEIALEAALGEIEQLRNQIDSLCGVLAQTASVVPKRNRAIRQVAINALRCHGAVDWIDEYGLEKNDR